MISGLTQRSSAYIDRVLAHFRMPLYGNGYALTSSAAGTSALGFLYWLLAARYYTTAAVGLNAAAITTMTFLASVARLYLDGVLIRFLPRAGVKASRLIRYAYFISGMAAAAVGTLFILGLNFWAPALGFLRASPALAAGFVLGTIASCIFDQQDGALTGLRQAKWVPLENTLFALAKLLLLVALARPLPDYGIFLSWSIPLFVSLFPVNLLIFRKLLPQHVRKSSEPEAGVGASQIIHYAGGLYTGYLFLTASLRLLPLLVLQVAGSSAAAFFTLPWMIVTSLRLVIPSMMGSLTVEASRDQTKLVRYSRQVFAQTARLLVPVVALLVVAAPYLLHLFGRGYASEATPLLRLLSLATLPQVVIGLYLGIARVRRSVGGVIAVHASSFVMILGLSYYFLAEFGITGVGIAWLIGQTIVALVLFFTQLRPLLWSTRDLGRADSLDGGVAVFEYERRPDFFIVGAPKCGTTAMNAYLRQHPQIFMPKEKDISFFGQDLQFRRPRITRERYLSLFLRADGALRVGETSVWYLYSRQAAEEIKAFSPAARIIVMLRNPVDMLYAQHSEFLHNCNEEIEDFKAALDAEEDRRQGRRLPKKVHLVEGLFYRDTANYTGQVSRYFDVFGRQNVHVIIFDDFKQDPGNVFGQTLAFLRVDPDFRPKFRRVNSNKVLRSRRLQELLVAPPFCLKRTFHAITPPRLRGQFLPYLRRLNIRYVDRPPLDSVVRKRLQMEFEPEVKRLGELLDRDLSYWYES